MRRRLQAHRRESRCSSGTRGRRRSRGSCGPANFVFVAGQLGFKQGARDLVPGGVGPETHAALEAIASNLGQAGLGMDDVVQCDVFLAGIADFQAMNEAYARFFPRNPPARTTVGVAGLWGNARVEIDCIAVTR